MLSLVPMQALHCFYRDQWQLINAKRKGARSTREKTKRARVLGQHATGNTLARLDD